MTNHLRVLQPHTAILAFYDGRIENYRYDPGPNWVDEGALSVGIASYAIVDGAEALVYDTHVSIEHARFIRNHLEQLGVSKITVLLSHHHLDHVAGTEVFSDCVIISNLKTADHLGKNRQAIEAGTHHGSPAISPLILPTQTFSGETTLRIGNLNLKLIEANIHSDDATVIWIENESLLLCGDTMEDTITYVVEPEHFDTHLKDLDRLWLLKPDIILPNHGDPDIIRLGGYEKTLLRATQQYIRMLKRMPFEPELRNAPLTEIINGPLEAGWVNLYAPYEDVHRENIALVMQRLSS
jgi:cyclase